MMAKPAKEFRKLAIRELTVRKRAAAAKRIGVAGYPHVR